jgi:ketosteroid isomerase-like protein
MKKSSVSCWLYVSASICIALLLITRSLEAQGIVDVIIPKSGASAEAVYRAKVRDSVTATLHKWAKSLEQRDSVAAAAAYTPNARSLMGDEPEAITAGAVVRQLFKTTLAGAYVDVSIQDFDMSGDLAFVSSVLLAPGPDRGAAPTLVRSLFIFRFDAWHDRWQVREQFIDLRGGTEAAQSIQ